MRWQWRYSCIIFVVLILFSQIDIFVAGTSSFEDQINDVVYFSAGVSQTNGITTYPEIDIYNVWVKTNDLSIDFQADVVDDAFHYYTISVWWNGDDNDNITIGSFGRGTYNSVKTFLKDSSGVTIVNNNLSGIIDIAGDELIFQIPNSSLITAPTPPGNVKAEARYDNFTTNEYYYDDLVYPRTDLFSGYTFVFSLIGISIITIAVYFIRKHKKSGV